MRYVLQQGLKHVVAAELVYQSGLPPQARYLFKHALMQDAAYQSLLKSTPPALPSADCPAVRAPLSQTSIETQPELVAHHYTEAGFSGTGHSLLAAGGAKSQSAFGQRGSDQPPHESPRVAHDSAGHAGACPAGTRLARRPWGPYLMAAKGYAAPEAEKVYTRARELCQQVGETPQLFPVL